MFTVSVAAATTALTILATVKTELGLTATDEDAYLNSKIPRVSALISAYLNVAPAADGTRTLGRETLVETFRRTNVSPQLILARHPVTSITSVVVDGTALVAADYEIDKATGVLYRMVDTARITWAAGAIVVTYVAGWLLPGDASRNLPFDIEDAAIDLVKSQRASRHRDPLVKSEDVSGVLSTTYWVGSVSDDVMPPEIAHKLAPYRNITF